jgi:hypothetical protein
MIRVLFLLFIGSPAAEGSFMATKGGGKGSIGNGTGGSRIKFRFVDIEMENVDESITEALKSLAGALSRGHATAPPARQLAGGAKHNLPVAQDVIAEEGEVLSPEAEVEEVPEETEGVAASPGNGNKPKKKYAPKAPKFLSDLDLTTAPVKLEDFVKEKSPADMMCKYTVIAFWFKEYFTIEEITTDHIFTAFKHLGWQSQMPDDPVQTFRNAKSLKNWFDKGAKGAYKINWNGQNAVNKMGVPTQ